MADEPPSESGCFHCRGEAAPLPAEDCVGADGAARLYALMCAECQAEMRDRWGFHE